MMEEKGLDIDGRTPEEMAKEAAEFLNQVSDEVVRRRIPPQIAVALFGVFSRKIIDTMVEAGKPREEAIAHIAGFYMEALGVQTIFQRVSAGDGKPPPMH